VSENLPEQMHAPRSTGTAVAVPQQTDAFDLGGQDIRLPRMKVGQTQSPAVTEKIVQYGDVFVQRSKDDAEPVVLQENGELGMGELSDPIRFYIHGVRRGVNYIDPSNPNAGQNGMVLGPWGLSVLEFIQANPSIDPSRVYRKYDYTITLPDFELLPVAFLMASSWGGSAASDLNTTIQLQRSQGVDPTTLAFRVQFKPIRNDKGAFMKAFVGLAKVSAKDKEKDQELVAQHALLLPNAVIDAADEGEDAAGFPTTNAPSVA
jgi:hypothetical protein